VQVQQAEEMGEFIQMAEPLEAVLRLFPFVHSSSSLDTCGRCLGNCNYVLENVVHFS
jgi:hypothetical protein